MYFTYPSPSYMDDRVRNKMSLRTVISNGEEPGSLQAARPFYLYKGLDPKKEEALKIYPVDSNNSSDCPASRNPSVSPFSSISSASSSSTMLNPIPTYQARNSVSGLGFGGNTRGTLYALPSPPSSISKGRVSSFSLYHQVAEQQLQHQQLHEHSFSPSSSTSSMSNSDVDVDELDHDLDHEHGHGIEIQVDTETDDIGNENELIKEIRSGIENDRVKYKCNYTGCHYKGTFLSKDYLRRHIREQHRRSKEHICKGFHSNGEKWGCNKKFSRPYQLVNHWRGQRSLKRCGVPLGELRRCGIH